MRTNALYVPNVALTRQTQKTGTAIQQSLSLHTTLFKHSSLSRQFCPAILSNSFACL